MLPHLDLRWRKWREAGKDCIMRSFIIRKIHQILFMIIKSRKMRRAGHVARMGHENYIQHFGWKPWREESTWKTYV
jgi:hypothetical protein